MRKSFLFLCVLASSFFASAQFSLGINGNYTMYKQDFQKNTAGVGVRVYYEVSDKYSAVLSYTHGLPITVPSQVNLTSNNGSKTVNSEIQYNFKTINLLAQRTFIGDGESAGKFYGLFGPGLVLVNYNEKIKDSYDPAVYTPQDQISGNDNGFTLNLGLGGEFSLGTPLVYAEAALALPANNVNNYYVQNVIPTHFTFNVGIKFPLGSRDNYY